MHQPACNVHNIQSWLKEFVDNVVWIVPLKESTVNAFVGECNVSKFSEYVTYGIKKIKVTLCKKYSDVSWLKREMSGCSDSPDRLLYERLIGCTHKCPFCAEQCERTKPCQSTQNHFIKVHRYLSLGRWSFYQTNELVLRTCTDYAGTDESFVKTDGSLHKFCNCEEVYKNWKIQSNFTEPAYWRWFIYKFHSEIENWVGAQPTHVPVGWSYISENMAIGSLPHIINAT